jgi:Arc/MetJ family transcription regulator
MRTNIQLNDDLMKEARKYSRASTKRALIEEALQTFVRVKSEEKMRASYTDRLDGLRARLSGLRLREKPGDVLREDRSR